MADAELSQLRRFRTAAEHYLAGRPAYAPRLIRHVARFTGVAPEHRILDLGCGPGMLAGAFALAGAEVLAMDPEPEMLRIAEAEFGGAGRISFVRGSSFDLSPALGRFRLVTMGRSFQWMDRVETLRRLDAMIEPGGRWCCSIAGTGTLRAWTGSRRTGSWCIAMRRTIGRT